MIKSLQRSYRDYKICGECSGVKKPMATTYVSIIKRFQITLITLKESLAELKKKYKKVLQDECEPHWNLQYKSSAKVLVCQLHPKPMREDTKGIGF